MSLGDRIISLRKQQWPSVPFVNPLPFMRLGMDKMESAALLVAGMSGVGKTTLLRGMQGLPQDFVGSCSTCVCDVAIVQSRSGKVDDESETMLTFFDLGGSPKFQTGRISIYCHAGDAIKGVVLVFDISNRKSFDALNDWYRELNVVYPIDQSDMFVKILVGNKLDKQTLSVSMPEVERWADKHGFRICLTAARDGRGVPEICPFIVEILRTSRRRKEGALIPADRWKVTPEQMIAVYRIIYGENEWERLGLSAGSNGALIAKAYRRLAAQIHPDKCPLNGSGEAFKLLTASKDTLLAPKDKMTV